MLVRDCLAHDGHRAPIQLVDRRWSNRYLMKTINELDVSLFNIFLYYRGCVSRPRIMSGFQKIRDFGPSATVVSYAYFQVKYYIFYTIFYCQTMLY